MAGIVVCYKHGVTEAQQAQVFHYISGLVGPLGTDAVAFTEVNTAGVHVGYGCTDTEMEAHLLAELVMHNYTVHSIRVVNQLVESVEVSVAI